MVIRQQFCKKKFSSVYTVESDNDFDTLPSRMDVQVDRTTFTLTEEDDISKKLIQLKIDKSPGPDLIHPRVLYETRDVIIRPLFLILMLKTSMEVTTVVRAQNDTSKTANITDTIFDRTLYSPYKRRRFENR